MAILFDDHPTAIQTKRAFVSAGRRFNKRLELRTFLPGLQFVSEGFCYMVCDMITAQGYLFDGTGSSTLTMRRVLPRVSASVSILTPAYVGQARLAQAFAAHLAQAIRAMPAQAETALAACA